MSGPRIHLRPFKTHDAPAFMAAVNASLDTLIPWMVWAHNNYTLEEAEGWIAFTQMQRSKGEAQEYAIVDDDDRLLGGAGLRFARDVFQNNAMGYWVRSDVQRQGIASRAVQILAQHAFSSPAIPFVEILIAEDNIASRGVAERCGATYIDCRYGLIVLESGPVNTAVYHLYPKSGIQPMPVR